MTRMITADLSKGLLHVLSTSISIACIVRNELNGWRKLDQIVYSIPDNKPIQPRQFPKGIWAVGRPDPREDSYLAPFFIPTSAWQYLPIWELDEHHYYKKATSKLTKDKGYGLHFSTSTSTQGCIKILDKDDLLWLVTKLKNLQSQGDVFMLEVV